MAKAKPLTVDCPYTHRQLCRVKRVHGVALEAGAVLAYDGAWDRKSMVQYVLYLGLQPGKYSSVDRHTWAVGLEQLGLFYADGRTCPAPERRVREVLIQLPALDSEFKGVGKWLPVVPTHKPEPESFELRVAPRPARAKPYKYQSPKAVGVGYQPPRVQSPEAILAHFLIQE